MAILQNKKIKWQPSPNFWKGRNGYTVKAIVIHITDGTLSSVLSWFEMEKSQVSAHYVIAKDGEIINMVKEEDSAWHTGIVVKPKWSKIIKNINPNYYTIGIEVVGWSNDRFTFEQNKSIIQLIRKIKEKYRLILSSNTVVNHRDIDANKICPGKWNDAGYILIKNWLAD